MYYIIYETTNLLNGKKYIGKHITKKLDDNYLGSGRLIIKAINKYGKENFKKEILFIYETEKEMDDKEVELVNEEIIKNSLYYNLRLGGGCGSHSEESKKKIQYIAKERMSSLDERKRISVLTKEGMKNSNAADKISKSNKGRILSEETKRKIGERSKGNKFNVGRIPSKETRIKMGESKKGELNYRYGTHNYGSDNPMFGKQHSEETKKKISESTKGRVPWNKGKPRSEETKQKISNTKKKNKISNKKDIL